MTTLREAAEMALGTLQDVCERLLYRGVSKDAGHPDRIALEQARQTIQALKQATEQSKQKRDPIAWNGWIVREVLFDEGEPVGHRAPPQPVAQPEPEPVVDTEADVLTAVYMTGVHAGKKAATKRKPLTDDEIAALLSQSAGVDLKLNGGDLLFARAIERAHGIGGEE